LTPSAIFGKLHAAVRRRVKQGDSHYRFSGGRAASILDDNTFKMSPIVFLRLYLDYYSWYVLRTHSSLSYKAILKICCCCCCCCMFGPDPGHIRILYPKNIRLQKVIGNILFLSIWGYKRLWV
jgi:hypothetical protein